LVREEKEEEAKMNLCMLAHDKRLKSIEIHTEVIVDSIFDVLDSEKLRFVSTKALAFSPQGQTTFF
jgi:acyl-CoA hydrolase